MLLVVSVCGTASSQLLQQALPFFCSPQPLRYPKNAASVSQPSELGEIEVSPLDCSPISCNVDCTFHYFSLPREKQ